MEGPYGKIRGIDNCDQIKAMTYFFFQYTTWASNEGFNL